MSKPCFVVDWDLGSGLHAWSPRVGVAKRLGFGLSGCGIDAVVQMVRTVI